MSNDVAKIVLEVSMKREPTRMIKRLYDVAHIPIHLPSVVIEKLEDIGISHNGIPGRIVIFEDKSSFIEAVQNMMCFTPEMAKLTMKQIDFFKLSPQEIELIIICANYELYINKLLLPLQK
jgi:hypothetical protein